VTSGRFGFCIRVSSVSHPWLKTRSKNLADKLLVLAFLPSYNRRAGIHHHREETMSDSKDTPQSALPQSAPAQSGLSRRQFLRGSSVAAAATALVGAPAAMSEAEAGQAAAQAGGGNVPAMGPAPIKLNLNVNGRAMTTNVEPRVTLLDALRNYLDVTGCKRVCDRGSCGACTVLLDNKVVYACSMLAVEAQGKPIRTAESLVQGDKLDPVPAAFVQHDAQQCGFCTPGFVVAMKAVLEQNPKATPAEVEHGLQGNICRCGTYEQMRNAVYALCNQKRPG
jgi:xanthine dehydrogenase YagT iron-sulfur-binding subunit